MVRHQLQRQPLPTAPSAPCAQITVLLEDAATTSLASRCFLPLYYIPGSASALLLPWQEHINSSSGSKIPISVYSTESLWQALESKTKVLKNACLPYLSCKLILYEYGTSRYPLCRKTKPGDINKSDLFRYLSKSAVFHP